MTRSDIVAAARGWLRTPFVPQAASKGHGCDCAGLVIGIAKELGAAPIDFDPGPYKQSPDGTMIRLCDENLDHVDTARIGPGDIVAMRWDLEPQHLAVVVDYPGGRLGVVQSLIRRGGVVEHRLDSKWRRSIVAAYRFRGVA